MTATSIPYEVWLSEVRRAHESKRIKLPDARSTGEPAVPVGRGATIVELMEALRLSDHRVRELVWRALRERRWQKIGIRQNPVTGRPRAVYEPTGRGISELRIPPEQYLRERGASVQRTRARRRLR